MLSALLLDVLAWTLFGVVAGYLAHVPPVRWLQRDTPLTRLREGELSGRVYERWLRIGLWKGWLPEVHNAFGPGFGKCSLRSRDPRYLARFVAETRRAEWVHWSQLCVAPLFALWNPPSLFAVMVGYAVLANVPFLLAQRYNRARLLRVLARLSKSGKLAGVPPADSASAGDVTALGPDGRGARGPVPARP